MLHAARLRRQPEGGCSLVQSAQRLCGVDGLRAVLLGQFFTIRTQYQRGMQVLRRGQLQALLQPDLARGVVQQVGAAHHMADTLVGVIHHHGQLVGKAAVGAQQHEVAHRVLHILRLWPGGAVLPVDNGALGAQAPGPRRFAVQAGAAGTGVAQFRVARAGHVGGYGVFNVLARTAAGVGQIARHQALQCGAVQRGAGALPHGGRVGMQAAGGELRKYHAVRAGHGAWAIDVFDAHQPLATMCAGV